MIYFYQNIRGLYLLTTNNKALLMTPVRKRNCTHCDRWRLKDRKTFIFTLAVKLPVPLVCVCMRVYVWVCVRVFCVCKRVFVCWCRHGAVKCRGGPQLPWGKLLKTGNLYIYIYIHMYMARAHTHTHSHIHTHWPHRKLVRKLSDNTHWEQMFYVSNLHCVSMWLDHLRKDWTLMHKTGTCSYENTERGTRKAKQRSAYQEQTTRAYTNRKPDTITRLRLAS